MHLNFRTQSALSSQTRQSPSSGWAFPGQTSPANLSAQRDRRGKMSIHRLEPFLPDPIDDGSCTGVSPRVKTGISVRNVYSLAAGITLPNLSIESQSSTDSIAPLTQAHQVTSLMHAFIQR
eukprot:TRINITY_DN13557_c0_g2_i12.p1 TRINITY_DN13557_c0_g2~~TRINITY_DN13557_c0_g2_i12.p1  ORF type:complete len:121 (-),score=1.00 TRINITY_DN13557_c0_g2_i12:161-523(-)